MMLRHSSTNGRFLIGSQPKNGMKHLAWALAPPVVHFQGVLEDMDGYFLAGFPRYVDVLREHALCHFSAHLFELLPLSPPPRLCDGAAHGCAKPERSTPTGPCPV